MSSPSHGRQPGADPLLRLPARALTPGILLMLWSCGQASNFAESSNRRYDSKATQSADATGSTDTGTDTAPVLTPQSEDEFKAAIQTSEGQTVTLDTFLLPRSFPVTQLVENSRNPVKTLTAAQDLGAPRQSVHTVAPRAPQSRYFSKTPPLRRTVNHTVVAADKPVDIFITVDDSESFSGISIARAKNAVFKILEDLHATNWILFIGGLEGVSGSYDRRMVVKGTKTIEQARAAAEDALNQIFVEGSNGDERVFRSLNRLAYDYRGSDRDHAVHAYFVISDAPNCKDRFNNESGACTRVPGQWDHHTFLVEANPNIADHMRRHMTLFGAYYRQTNNIAACGSADDIENPPAGETLKRASQYAEAAFLSESSHIPTTPAGGDPAWVGDLCAAAESTAWISGFTGSVLTAAAQRFVLAEVPDTFTGPDADYQLKLSQGITVVDPSHWTLRGDQVLVQDGSLAGTVTATYHLHNNFRQTAYLNLLNPVPEAGSVRLTWAGGGPKACVRADSFAGQDVSTVCRHWDDDLHLRDVDFLPRVEPGQPDLVVRVDYVNQVTPTTQLLVSAAEPIFADTVAFSAFPPAAEALVAGATYTPQAGGRQMLISFAAELPPGDYRVTYRDYAQTRGTIPVTSPAAGGDGGLVCHLPGAAVADSAGALTVDPPSAQWPCAFNGDRTAVTFGDRIPVNGTSGKRELIAVYKGFVAPIPYVPLDYPPKQNAVSVVSGSIDDPDDAAKLAPDAYTVNENRLTFGTPLMPGNFAQLDYLFEPPLNDCHPLSATAKGRYSYHVWYGPPGKEEKQASTAFQVEEKSGKAQICLPKDSLAHGHRLVVGYVSAEREDIN